MMKRSRSITNIGVAHFVTIPIIQLVAFFHQFYYCDLCFLRIDNSNSRLSTLRGLFFALRVEEKKHENLGFFDVTTGLEQ